MAFRMTIGGVERASSIDFAKMPVTVSLKHQQRPTATFMTMPDYFPAKYSEVVIYAYDETTPIFGGFVLKRETAGVVERVLLSRAIVECTGFIAYADYCYITLNYTVATPLEDILDDIVTAKLGGYGITYTPSATGINIEPFTCENKRVSDLLRDLAARASRRIEVSPTKVLTVSSYGAASATSITDATPNCLDLTWSDSTDIAPTKIILICGSGTRQTSESFVGSDGVVSSGASHFTTNYPATLDYHGYWPNLITVNGTNTPVGWEPVTPMVKDGGPFEWVWDAVNHRLKHDDTTFGAVAGATTITNVRYTIAYPFTYEADSGASPAIEEVLVRPDILYREHAVQLAPSLLAQRGVDSIDLKIHTLSSQFVLGEKVTVNITARGGLNDDFLIVNHTTIIYSDHNWHYNLDAVNADEFRGDYVDDWREMSGDPIGGGNTAVSIVSGGSGSSGGTPTVVASPIWVYLGGSKSTSIAANPAAWVQVVNGIDYHPKVSFTAEVRVVIWARNAGVGVTARLHNVTDGTSVSSSKVTSTTPTSEVFIATIEAGKEYQLELLSDTDGEGVYGYGSLQTA